MARVSLKTTARSCARSIAATTAALLIFGGAVTAAPAQAGIESPGGAGSYTTDNVGAIPGGACGQTSLRDHLTPDAPNRPVPTNDWWTSLVFKFSDANGTQGCGQNLALNALPVQYSVEDGKKAHQYDGDSDIPGVHISYHPLVDVAGVPGGQPQDQNFHQYMRKDVLVAQVDGLGQTDAKVSNWSDWTVSTRQSDGSRTLDATIGQGLPFSWFRATGGNAKLKANGWTNVEFIVDGAVTNAPTGSLVVIATGPTNEQGQVADRRYYAAFAPVGASWSKSDEFGHWNDLIATSAGHFSVAALPLPAGASTAQAWSVAEQFAPYAHSPVTDTRADYTYDQSTGEVAVTYRVTADPLPGSGGSAGTAMALLPHQYAVYSSAEPSSRNSFISEQYSSPRGVMKTLVGVTSFTTIDHFRGVLTEVPAVATGVPDSAERHRLNAELSGYLGNGSLADQLHTYNTPTYGVGKALGRTARIVEVADQLGRTDVRDKALGDIHDTLTDWFTAQQGKSTQVFRYSSPWSSLIGYPADFFSDTELNDHHFHYGYYVMAAATLARFDPTWASDYGPMVELLIRDVNSPNRSDAMFPYLRYFNAYSGHDYAAGPAPYDAGNNQESSSEAMNATAGMLMWGEVTGNRTIRDAAVYMYTTQAAAINAYWFNDAGGALPSGFNDQVVPVVWTNGGTGGLFFGNGERAYKYGINTLPITGAFLYLTPSSVTRNYNALQAAPRISGENANEWRDVHLSALALADGAAALDGLNQLGDYLIGPDPNLPYTNEHGMSKAHTYHWIANLAALGTVDRSITANYPLAAVFSSAQGRTYVASNLGSAPINVTFSDCIRLDVAPGQTAWSGVWSGDAGESTGGQTLPIPDPGWEACLVDPEDPGPDPGDGSGPDLGDGDGDGSADPGDPDDGPEEPNSREPKTPDADQNGTAMPPPSSSSAKVKLKLRGVKITRGRQTKQTVKLRTMARIKVRFKAPKGRTVRTQVRLRVGKQTIGKKRVKQVRPGRYVAAIKVHKGKNVKLGKIKVRVKGTKTVRAATYKTRLRVVR
ncbi:Endoglucanase Acf2 [Micrococcales bacterium KH10]|nr:Endoglucanase Acf2 [Micrococcales bacterium KH10]